MEFLLLLGTPLAGALILGLYGARRFAPEPPSRRRSPDDPRVRRGELLNRSPARSPRRSWPRRNAVAVRMRGEDRRGTVPLVSTAVIVTIIVVVVALRLLAGAIRIVREYERAD